MPHRGSLVESPPHLSSGHQPSAGEPKLGEREHSKSPLRQGPSRYCAQLPTARKTGISDYLTQVTSSALIGRSPDPPSAEGVRLGYEVCEPKFAEEYRFVAPQIDELRTSNSHLITAQPSVFNPLNPSCMRSLKESPTRLTNHSSIYAGKRLNTHSTT